MNKSQQSFTIYYSPFTVYHLVLFARNSNHAQISIIVLFIMERRDITPVYSDWKDRQWQDFALSQFFREADGVGYSLEDAQEIYRS